MRILNISVVALAVVSVQVSAQQPANSEKPPVTLLSGCLKSSAADTAVAGPSGRIYTLEVIDAPPPVAAATSTASSNPPVASKTTYSLAAAESLGLAKHVDHEVELTGTLQAPAATTARPASKEPSAAKPGGAHRTFEVTAVKMLAPKCK
jgi:hypothetical protein